MKVVSAHLAGKKLQEDSDMFSACSSHSFSTNLIKRQQLRGTVETKIISGRIGCRLVRMENLKPYFSANKTCQEVRGGSAPSPAQQYFNKEDLHRRPCILIIKIQCQNYAIGHLRKPDILWKEVLWTNKVRI